MDTHALVNLDTYFNSAALKKIKGCLILESGEKLEFTKITKVVSDTDYDYNFNGKIKVIDIHLSTITEFKKLKNCTVGLKIYFGFEFSPEMIHPECEIITYGLLRKMYDERFFD